MNYTCPIDKKKPCINKFISCLNNLVLKLHERAREIPNKRGYIHFYVVNVCFRIFMFYIRKSR